MGFNDYYKVRFNQRITKRHDSDEREHETASKTHPTPQQPFSTYKSVWNDITRLKLYYNTLSKEWTGLRVPVLCMRHRTPDDERTRRESSDEHICMLWLVQAASGST